MWECDSHKKRNCHRHLTGVGNTASSLAMTPPRIHPLFPSSPKTRMCYTHTDSYSPSSTFYEVVVRDPLKPSIAVRSRE